MTIKPEDIQAGARFLWRGDYEIIVFRSSEGYNWMPISTGVAGPWETKEVIAETANQEGWKKKT